MKISEIANICRIAFLLGLINKTKITEWSDKMINDGDLDNFYLCLSLSKNNKDILNCFSDAVYDCQDIDYSVINEYFLGYFKILFGFEGNRLKWAKIQEIIISYFSIIDFQILNESQNFFVLNLRDDYSLRNEGFGGSIDMPIDLIVFLNQFNLFNEIQAKLDVIHFPKLEIQSSC
jgi:hypothetical protein